MSNPRVQNQQDMEGEGILQLRNGKVVARTVASKKSGSPDPAETDADLQNSSFLSKVFSFGRRNQPPSSSVSSAATKKAVATAQQAKKIAEIQDRIATLEEIADLDSCEVEREKKSIARLISKCDPSHPNHDPDTLTDLKKEIQSRTDTLEDKEADFMVSSRRSKTEIGRLQREIEVLTKEFDAGLAVLDEESEQYLGSDEDDEEIKELTDRLKLLKSGGDEKKEEEQQVNNPGSFQSKDSALESIAQTLQTQNQALLKILSTNQQPSTTDKMLIRQSVGRDLPVFNGRPEEWPTFLATYKRTTEACGFSEAENVERIRKCLRGDAYKSVECLLVSPDSLSKVLQVLKEKYGQPQVIVRAMVIKTRNVGSVKEDKPQTMIDYGTAVINLVATIKNLGQEEHLRNPLLLDELLEKLPVTLRHTWEEYSMLQNSVTNLELFSEWIEKRVKIACRMCPPKPPDKKDDKQMSSTTRESKRQSDSDATAAGLFTGQTPKQCIFCHKSNHQSHECFQAEKMSTEDKKLAIKKMRACFACLRPNHTAKDCRAKKNLSCSLCSRQHYAMMCPGLQSIKDEGVTKTQPGGGQQNSGAQRNPGQSENTSSSASAMCRKDILLKTLVVRVSGPEISQTVRLVLDDGSQTSHIGSTTAEIIGSCPIGKEWLSNVLFGGSVTNAEKVNLHQVEVSSLDGKAKRLFTLRETPLICGMIPRVPQGPWINKLRKKKIWLSDFELCHVDNPQIEVLIGTDYWNSVVIGKKINLEEGFSAIETIFGWALSGPVPNMDRDSSAMMVTSMISSQAELPELWKLETIGIMDPVETKTKEENAEAAKKHFKETVTRGEDGRYSAALPWINKESGLPTNRSVAEKRLISTTAKLHSTGNYDAYDQIFNQWAQEGIIEEVPEDNKNIGVHYLPHRAVIKASVTTPIRPVFDASAKVGRYPSLNDCLEKGPNLLELIPSILHRFRMNRVGVTSDIRKAFQMIAVHSEDRDYQRFLWWDNSKDKTIKIYRHCRVVFGINCSPFLLGAVLEEHLTSIQDSRKEVAELLLGSLYVDNCVTSVDNMENYLNFKEEATQILSEAQMELRQWEFGYEGNVMSETDENLEDQVSSVLGILWDKEKDVLMLDIPIPEIEKISKRSVLSKIQKIYDPLGFAAPALIGPKLLLQNAWRLKLGWDEELPMEFQEEFGGWWKSVGCLSKIQIPRHAFKYSAPDTTQLHVFCDASKIAYAAAVFLRVTKGDEVSVQLLQCKTRVAPLKVVTIPRMELLGCTIAARLFESVRNSLKLKTVPTVMWSDSSTALAWIKRNNQWGTFVNNRVKEICKLSSPDMWRHVPGSLNPADLPSRGCSPSQLLQSQWWEGPSWLRQSEEYWPSTHEPVNEEEVMTETLKTVVSLFTVQAESWWSFARFSSYTKTVRVMGWVLRLIKKTGTGDLSQAEFQDAENRMFTIIQWGLNIKDGFYGGVPVFKDEHGIYRVQTKLLNREETNYFRFPVVLPPDHPLVEQMIREKHLNNCHAGTQTILGMLREKVWIVRGRQAVKKIVNSCVKCRRYATKAPSVPPAPLPKNRVKDAKTFEVTGVDLAGPLFLKNGSKEWIVLFTCAIYRCVHLELAESLSTESFLMSLQRFIKRRGRPSTIYSDNGTNFVGAENYFKSLDWKRIQGETRIERIQWIFNPPSAAWWGGWWERLIRMMKDLIKRMLGKRKLTYQQLETTLCEVEAAMNSRPLTYISGDIEDLIPLSPSMFLQEITETNCTDVETYDANELRQKYKTLALLKQELRSRFRKEYLSLLVQRGKTKPVRVFQVGEVVLIGSDNKKRLDWPMGKILELLPGKDGETRVAKVKTATGVLIRPLQRLYPLEVIDPVEIIEAVKDSQEPEVPAVPEIRKTRYGREVRAPQRFGDRE